MNFLTHFLFLIGGCILSVSYGCRLSGFYCVNAIVMVTAFVLGILYPLFKKQKTKEDLPVEIDSYLTTTTFL